MDDITYSLSEGQGQESISELIFSQWWHHVQTERETGPGDYQQTHFQSMDDITYILSEGQGRESISELIFSQSMTLHTR